jgi:SAM-dependent methyltransferase
MQNSAYIDLPEITKLNEPNIEALPPVFTKIALRVRSFVSAFGKQDLQDGMRSLDQSYSRMRTQRIDYEHLATHFTYAYFLENFWKASCAFLKNPPPVVKDVMDVGCGSGATLFAYLAALDHGLSNTEWKINVFLMDRSKAHLNIAEHVLNAIRGDFENLNIFHASEDADFLRHRVRDGVDALLLGHVLNENSTHISEFLEQAFASVKSGGRVYIIERADDLIWDEINHEMEQLPVYAKTGITSLKTSYIDSKGSDQLSNKGSDRLLNNARVSARYLVLHLPDNKRLVSLLRLYFKAWRTQSTELLKEIFAPNAKYHEKPHRLPLRGLEQIERYWEAKVQQQRCLDVRVLRAAYSPQEAFAEWSANFIMLGERVQVTGVLILRVDLNDCRVTSLHEYFRTSTSPE